MTEMKAYMGYDRVGGSGEGAGLVFDVNAKEARKRAYHILQGWYDVEWIDCSARLLRDLPPHLKRLDNGQPQSIESPPECSRCGMWGGHKTECGGCLLCEGECDD